MVKDNLNAGASKGASAMPIAMADLDDTVVQVDVVDVHGTVCV